jgi:hypothetical protein
VPANAAVAAVVVVDMSIRLRARIIENADFTLLSLVKLIELK